MDPHKATTEPDCLTVTKVSDKKPYLAPRIEALGLESTQAGPGTPPDGNFFDYQFS